jgi:ferredoxin--NADP+ reductase
LIETGALFRGVGGRARLDPATDRVMLCGSMDMIRTLAAQLDALGFAEGSNAKPGHYVIERAFVD